MNAVEVRDLTWRYEHTTRPALEGVNLDIVEREFVLVVGPNEAGKTTLVAAIKGIIPHSMSGILKGEVRVFGERVEDMKAPPLARQIGMVFADPESQFTALTVEEEIVFGLENIGWPPAGIERQVRWAAEVTDVADLLDKPPYDISGGQKQRVAIASVIAMEPRILILDEPTSMIDPLGKDQVRDICAELKREREMTIIVVEHNIEAFAPLADKVVVVNDGHVERVGPPAELFAEIEYLAARDLAPPQVTTLFERLRRPGRYVGELPLTDEAGIAAGRRLLEAAR
ncbi:MAG TPA: ATP-binding cassette domain-containing protein [Candidatus Binatia bacterium]|nr:ATP-binding cassette domain-containing protein [Candidatus Binatia bacterium]